MFDGWRFGARAMAAFEGFERVATQNAQKNIHGTAGVRRLPFGHLSPRLAQRVGGFTHCAGDGRRTGHHTVVGVKTNAQGFHIDLGVVTQGAAGFHRAGAAVHDAKAQRHIGHPRGDGPHLRQDGMLAARHERGRIIATAFGRLDTGDAAKMRRNTNAAANIRTNADG